MTDKDTNRTRSEDIEQTEQARRVDALQAQVREALESERDAATRLSCLVHCLGKEVVEFAHNKDGSFILDDAVKLRNVIPEKLDGAISIEVLNRIVRDSSTVAVRDPKKSFLDMLVDVLGGAKDN